MGGSHFSSTNNIDVCDYDFTAPKPWRHHNTELLFTLWNDCKENPPVTSGSTHKGPIIQSFDVFFVIMLDKLLNKQSSGSDTHVMPL